MDLTPHEKLYWLRAFQADAMMTFAMASYEVYACLVKEGFIDLNNKLTEAGLNYIGG